MKIVLNGNPFEFVGPKTIAALLADLEIDARRVAVEHNLIVLKRAAFDTTEVQDGDQVEIVNFVGGGSHHHRHDGAKDTKQLFLLNYCHG